MLFYTCPSPMAGHRVATVVRGLGREKEGFGHKSVGFVFLLGVC